jgi:hypothetical protein
MKKSEENSNDPPKKISEKILETKFVFEHNRWKATKTKKSQQSRYQNKKMKWMWKVD